MLDLQEALKKLYSIENQDQLEEFNQEYLSKKWLLNQEFWKLKDLPVEEKKEFGWKLSNIKNVLNTEYKQKENQLLRIQINKNLEEDLVDISIPGNSKEAWNLSLLAQTRRELEDICRSMWFIVEYGNEVVTKYENFESVNIPLTHPATEMHDTIYIDQEDSEKQNFVFRTHTSAMQNFLIKKHWTPLKIVVPGRCYRFDEMDATHDTMFYQIEWLYIDENVSIAHFKNVITNLLSAIIKADVEIRMRPAYFPFVEPGFEIDVRYDIIDQKTWEKTKSKRMELLWAGMVHPNVIKEAGLDPEKYSWFAFGIWLSRLTAVRHKIHDIRYFTNWDMRFAKSF